MYLKDTPKQLYFCQFPGCERQFVRQDLRTRHRERHTRRESHFQKQEQGNQVSKGYRKISPPSISVREQRIASGRNESQSSNEATPQSQPVSAELNQVPCIPVRPTVLTPLTEPKQHFLSTVSIKTTPDKTFHAESSSGNGDMTAMDRSNGYEQHFPYEPLAYESGNPTIEPEALMTETTLSREGFEAYIPRPVQIPCPPSAGLSRPRNPIFARAPKFNSPSSAYFTPAGHPIASRALVTRERDSASCEPSQEFRPPLPLSLSSLPPMPSTVPAGHRNYTTNSVCLSPVKTSTMLEAQDPVAVEPNPNLIDSYGNALSMPVFGVHGYGLSPAAMAEDFHSWLFSPNLTTVPSTGSRHGHLSIGQTAFMDGSGGMSYGAEGALSTVQYSQTVPTQHRMAVNNILDTAVTPTILCDDKRKELLNLIDSRFHDRDHAPARKHIKDILGGDRDADAHVLSLKMMKTYIGSYWYHFHPQMPILHQPTFSPNTTKNLLLLAVITIGASSLDKLHGEPVTTAAADLSDFLAWHLRDEIFKDVDFLPPAKLWVFQTLILLEIYEKMYSTRILHERAHIHHGTTLTLMRRGSSLIGRSALDSPAISRDDRLSSASATNSRGRNSSRTEQWWNHWITNEATRRVAFAAFIIDSIHATMFGHSATLVAHEMKLQLPCDESAWSASSSVEVGRIEANLQANGIKPISFFDGLRHTLNHKPVRTNPFGRTALMAGLLSVSWHMNQRDVQVRSLGALKALGGKDIWRGTLTKAFNSWRTDFDQSIGKDSGLFSGIYQASVKLDDDTIFENRIVLHHLAHMAMHVDIVSCQIFAKASRLLGRTTLPADYTIAQKRIRENWAPKASARHATFFALKFLALTLLPDMADSQSSPETLDMGEEIEYSARDDFLLNRPWVLYFAALTVWSYGFALDGKVRCLPQLNSFEQEKNDMRLFLQRVGGVKSPEVLEYTPDRNCCIGLLLVLQRMFRECRWELVHEAATLLGNCIEMLKGE